MSLCYGSLSAWFSLTFLRRKSERKIKTTNPLQKNNAAIQHKSNLLASFEKSNKKSSAKLSEELKIRLVNKFSEILNTLTLQENSSIYEFINSQWHKIISQFENEVYVNLRDNEGSIKKELIKEFRPKWTKKWLRDCNKEKKKKNIERKYVDEVVVHLYHGLQIDKDNLQDMIYEICRKKGIILAHGKSLPNERWKEQFFI